MLVRSGSFAVAALTLVSSTFALAQFPGRPGHPGNPGHGGGHNGPVQPWPGNPGHGGPVQPWPGNPGWPQPGHPGGNPGWPQPGHPGGNPGWPQPGHPGGNPGWPQPGNPGWPQPGNPGGSLQLGDNVGSSYINIARYNTYSFQLIAYGSPRGQLRYGCYRNCVGVNVDESSGWVSIYAGSSVPIGYNMQFGVTDGYRTVYKNYQVNFR